LTAFGWMQDTERTFDARRLQASRGASQLEEMAVPLAILSALAAAAQPVVLPAEPELRKQIEARDSELFDTVFGACAPAHLRSLITDDIEFFHDRDGASFGADAFLADYARFCAGQAGPGWHSRRALVSTSLKVAPIPGYGAIETGEHLFYERKGNGPERLAGRATFAHVWRRTADGWRLARALSYGHQAADAPAK
jgi:ketosteroid isomerase-like protein